MTGYAEFERCRWWEGRPATQCPENAAPWTGFCGPHGERSARVVEVFEVSIEPAGGVS